MEISPDKQNIDTVFSNTNYYIDFYQREYKWTKDQVKTLLDDIFYKFNLDYKEHLEAEESNIVKEYSWYYLNTYITNKSEGKTFIVDGQQRLTTLSLILIKLFHLSREKHSTDHLHHWIRSKILGYSSKGEEFWMGHDKRKETLKDLFGGKELQQIKVAESITAQNMVQNYDFISTYLDKSLTTKHRLETFVLYFLKRLVLINLDVAQTDVPMVFEVINDRGARLKPYEILKGKLLGQIDKNEVETYCEIWENSIKALEANEKELVDDFFRTYFKAKFSTTRAEGRKFDGDYQRVIFESPYNEQLQLKTNPVAVKNFIKNEFQYFAALYKRISVLAEDSSAEQPYVYFNKLNEMDTQVMLILAACQLNDPYEEEKIHSVSRLIDRTYVLLQLNKAYDSNKFIELAYALNAKVAQSPVEQFDSIFEENLLARINEKRNAVVESAFQYKYFKEVGYQDFNKRFLRYFFARVEHFISTGIRKTMQDTLSNLVLSTGKAKGFHVEHILGRNDENLRLFDNNDELFERERNRLGGLLLLLGKDNQSSGNESYQKKLETYSGALFWNHSLREDFYKSKLDNVEFIRRTGLNFQPVTEFNQEALENRSQLLFELVREIWGDPVRKVTEPPNRL